MLYWFLFLSIIIIWNELDREFPKPPHKTKKAVCFLSPPRIKVKKVMQQNPNTKRNLTPVFDAAAATEGVGR